MKKRMTLLIAGLAALVLVLSACQRGGVNSDDAALIRQQLEDVANRLNVVEDRIEDLASEATGSEMLISQVRNELNQARNTLADVDDKLATTADEEMADDGLTDDGLNNDLNDLGNDARDTLDGMGDSLNQFGDDLNEGFQEFGDDVDQRIDDLQDNLNNDGLNNDLDNDLNDATPAPTPADPGTGGGASDTVPGIPAAPGL